MPRRRPLQRDPLYEEYLLNRCSRAPTTILKRYQELFYNRFGFYVSYKAINRCFKENNVTLKKLSRVALESNDEEEVLFWRAFHALVPDLRMVVFGDETYRSDKTVNPTRGRGIGRVYCKVKFTRGGYKYSLLLFIGVNGVVEYQIYFGAVTEELFNQFIATRLSTFLNPYPGFNSVVIIDNVPFHHNGTLVRMIQYLGCVLLFLPRYMPKLNLAECGFRDVKAIEISKCIYGELEGLISLANSVESVRHKDYSKELAMMGYL